MLRSAMKPSELTSAEAFEQHVPGKLIAGGGGRSWKDLLVQLFSRQHEQDTLIVPAVPEPLIVLAATKLTFEGYELNRRVP